MIASHDRSGWFGASDTGYIMGRWDTKTFYNWWMVKLGFRTEHYTNQYMMAGTYYEHKILDSLEIPGLHKDSQILLPELCLRVNLDGDTDSRIYEVKTHKAEKPFKVSKQYYNQVQVQMFADRVYFGRNREAEIVSYGLEEEDYRNYFNPIDEDRRGEHQVEYDAAFIEKYLPRLRYLAGCLKKGMIPRCEDVRKI